MKKMLILIICLAMTSVATFAAEEKGRQGKGDRLTRMQKNLGLTDQQVEEIRGIVNGGGGREEVLAVLTEEQIEIMKERRAQMKGKGRKGQYSAPKEDTQVDETTDG